MSSKFFCFANPKYAALIKVCEPAKSPAVQSGGYRLAVTEALRNCPSRRQLVLASPRTSQPTGVIQQSHILDMLSNGLMQKLIVSGAKDSLGNMHGVVWTKRGKKCWSCCGFGDHFPPLSLALRVDYTPETGPWPKLLHPTQPCTEVRKESAQRRSIV